MHARVAGGTALIAGVVAVGIVLAPFAGAADVKGVKKVGGSLSVVPELQGDTPGATKGYLFSGAISSPKPRCRGGRKVIPFVADAQFPATLLTNLIVGGTSARDGTWITDSGVQVRLYPGHTYLVYATARRSLVKKKGKPVANCKPLRSATVTFSVSP